MSYPLIGALLGLAFAVVEYFIFGALLTRSLKDGTKGPGPAILDLVRKAQIVLFPIIGYVVGSLLSTENGAQ
jgi:hypothetical protein